MAVAFTGTIKSQSGKRRIATLIGQVNRDDCVATQGLTYGVDGYASCKVQVLLAVCIPHPDALSMGEDNVWSHICLQYIPAAQAGFMPCTTCSANQRDAASLLFSCYNVLGESSRILDAQVSPDSIGS